MRPRIRKCIATAAFVTGILGTGVAHADDLDDNQNRTWCGHLPGGIASPSGGSRVICAYRLYDPRRSVWTRGWW